MLKVHIRLGGRFPVDKVKFRGSALDLVSHTTCIIARVYANISAMDEEGEEAKFFKEAVQMIIADDNSPVWAVEEKKED